MALASYVPAANLVPTAQQFAADLAMVITTVVAALQQAGILASTAIVAAGELADGLADVLGMVEDGVGALVELTNYIPTAGLGALAQQFATDLAAVITAVVNALVQAGLLANEAVVRAGELADGLADILSVVADGVEAITALTAYVAASGIQEQAAAFAAALATVLNAIVNGLGEHGLLARPAVVAPRQLAGRLGAPSLRERPVRGPRRRVDRRYRQAHRLVRGGVARAPLGLDLRDVVVAAGERRGHRRRIQACAAGDGGHGQHQRRETRTPSIAAHRTTSWP